VGWSKEGLQQFNELYTEVQKDREKIMQFMWKKGIGFVVPTRQPEQEKGVFIIMNLHSKVDTFQGLLHR